jgi:hypothetical protein
MPTSYANVIIAGDFNGRHISYLGDKKTTIRGNQIQEWATTQGLTCFNKSLAYGQPTFYTHYNEEKSSIIDLFFSTSTVLQPELIIHDNPFGSDHFPLSFTFQTLSTEPPPSSHPRKLWNIQRLQNPKYKQKYITLFKNQAMLLTPELEQALISPFPPDLDHLNTAITTAIQSALTNSVGIKKPKPRQPWYWSAALDQAATDRDLLYTRFRRTHSKTSRQLLWTQYRHAVKALKHQLKLHQQHSWKQFLHSFHEQSPTDSSRIIKRIRKSQGMSPSFTHPAGPARAAETMKDTLAKVFDGHLLNSSSPPPPEVPSGPYNSPLPFSVFHIHDMIVNHLSRNKAPGVDHIRTEMLLPIPKRVSSLLYILFSICWKWGSTPSAWRLAQVCPIFKKGDPSDPANYRPISLTSVFRKLFELSITQYLHFNSPSLDIVQGGFRSQRSSLDQVLALHDICRQHKQDYKEDPVLAFLDIKSAYDTVDRNIIWGELARSAPPPLLALLMNLFNQVSMQILLQGFTSSSFNPTTGVLQGSILSPFLYSLYINSLPKFLRSVIDQVVPYPPTLYSGMWFNLLLYADDCVLIGTPDNIQFLLDQCSSFAHIKGFKWNAAKSVVLNHPKIDSPLTLDSAPIPFAPDFAYLGIPLSAPFAIDSALLVRKNSTRAAAAANCIAKLGFYSPQAQPTLLRHLFLTFVRPCFEYGLAITRLRSTIDIPLLERSHNTCLRRLFGGHSHSSTKVLRRLLNLPSLEDRSHILRFKYLNRFNTLPESALLPTIVPQLKAQKSRKKQHQYFKLLTNNPIISFPHSYIEPQIARKLVRSFLDSRIHQEIHLPDKNTLLKHCSTEQSLDPLTYLPMLSRDRNRIIRWKRGWLPGKPISCPNCVGPALTTRAHLISCLGLHAKLDLPLHLDSPGLLDQLLALLPAKRPTSEPKISLTYFFWLNRWPTILAFLGEVDKFSRPDTAELASSPAFVVDPSPLLSFLRPPLLGQARRNGP